MSNRGPNTDAVLAEADARGVQAMPLSIEVSSSHVSRLREKFGSPSGSLWEGLSDCASWHDPAGWRTAPRLPPSGPTIIMIEDWGGIRAVELDSPDDLPSILEACEGFVFYLTDPDHTYVLAFNDHDMLIGCGRARDWLELARHGSDLP